MRFRAPRRLGHVLEHTADGPVVYLCPLPSGPVTALTGSGAVIWTFAVEESDDVVELVAADFGVTPESIQEDVDDFLQGLLDVGLLEGDT